MPADSSARWHAALAYAVLGRVPDGLAEPARVDLEQLLRDLDADHPGGIAGISADLRDRRVTRLPAYPIPDELRVGLSPAQLAAVLLALQDRLGLGRAAKVTTDRPLDVDERRLQADVPPHHGS